MYYTLWLSKLGLNALLKWTPVSEVSFSLFKLFYVVASLAIMLLSARQKSIMWPLNMAKKTVGLFIYYHLGLYVKCTLDLILIFKSLYGWYWWRSGPHHSTPAPSLLAWRGRALLLAVVVVGSPLVAKAYEHFAGARFPYLDSLHALLILATYSLMTQKKIEGWVCWILANAVYVGLTWQAAELLIFFKYLTYLPCGVYGLYKWMVATSQAVALECSSTNEHEQEHTSH